MADDQIPIGESVRVRNTTIVKPIVYGNISYPFPKKRETGKFCYSKRSIHTLLISGFNKKNPEK
jgi:hypothetical protein